MEVPLAFSKAIDAGKLDADQLRSLAEQIEQATSPAERERLRNRLVQAHLALVLSVYREKAYSSPFLDPMDLIQEGVLGLLEAAKGYDHRRGDFAPYAWAYVRRAMSQAVAKASRLRSESHALEDVDEDHLEAWDDEVDCLRRDRILAAIETLSETDSDILTRRLNGESYSTIGRALGMPKRTVHKRAGRIFRELLEGEE